MNPVSSTISTPPGPSNHVVAQLVADFIGVPVRGAQQPLHAVGGHLAGGLGQRPTVLALQLAQQPAQIGQHPGPRLRADERTRDPPMHVLQARRPVLHLGHQAIPAHRHTLLPASARSRQRHTFKCRCSTNGGADSSMATGPSSVTVIGGVDTHKHTHYAAAIDDQGRLLGHQEFPATEGGYRALLSWLADHGNVQAIGVESTGSFGATLTRSLTQAGQRVIEVNRPNRMARRMDGKSDRLDAEQIARAVLGQTATATPKAKSGAVEVIRTLRVTRASAVKARTQAFNTLWGVIIGAPSPLRDELVVLTKRTLVNRCLGLRPATEDLLSLSGDPERLLLAAVKSSLRDLDRKSVV